MAASDKHLDDVIEDAVQRIQATAEECVDAVRIDRMREGLLNEARVGEVDQLAHAENRQPLYEPSANDDAKTADQLAVEAVLAVHGTAEGVASRTRLHSIRDAVLRQSEALSIENTSVDLHSEPSQQRSKADQTPGAAKTDAAAQSASLLETCVQLIRHAANAIAKTAGGVPPRIAAFASVLVAVAVVWQILPRSLEVTSGQLSPHVAKDVGRISNGRSAPAVSDQEVNVLTASDSHVVFTLSPTSFTKLLKQSQQPFVSDSTGIKEVSPQDHPTFLVNAICALVNDPSGFVLLANPLDPQHQSKRVVVHGIPMSEESFDPAMGLPPNSATLARANALMEGTELTKIGMVSCRPTLR